MDEFLQCKTKEHLQGSPVEIHTDGVQNGSVLMSESPLHDWQSMTDEDVPVNKSDLSRKLFTEDDSEGCMEETGVMEVTQEDEINHKDEVDGLSEMISKKLSLESKRETLVNSDTASFKNDDNQLFIIG